MEPAYSVVCRTKKKPHHFNPGLFLGIVYLLFSTCDAGSKFHRPAASVIARRAGAAQYAEMFDEGDVRSRHGIHKRLVGSGEDLDYESYQGVLGRPGLDFPVLTGIPNTNFNCRDVGNGYFADLATDCQVFHICDGGRKISFLCPNGTIFRQNDLICDWWFKVNCALSPSLYAESSEILSRSQSQAAAKSGNQDNNLSRRSSRLQIPLPVDGVNSNATTDTAKSNKEPNVKVSQVPTITGRKSFQETTSRSRTGGTKLRSRQYASFEYSSQQDGSAESFDFEEFLVPRRRPSYRARVPVRIVHPDFIDGRHIYRGTPIAFRVDPENKESQEYAESASFLKTRNTFSGYDYKQPIGPNRIQFDKVKTVERTRDDKAIEDFDQFSTTSSPPVTSTTLVNRGTMVFAMTSTTGQTYDDGKYTTQAPIDVRTSGKYSTARRLETSRTTPFYTPTIPTIATRFEGTATTSSSPAVVVTKPSTPISNAGPTTSPTPLSLEKNPINVSEHAIEMMKTLQELEMVSSTLATPNDPDLGPRLGLNIPPSSGPDALHSLAVYFANAMENSTKTVEQQASNTNSSTIIETSSGDDNEKLRAANLRDKTVEGYEKLFQTTVTEPIPTTPGSDILNRIAPIADQDKNDLDLQQSRNPIYAAASQPQIRELAQLFTQALSAYLHDPDGFRKILAEIRPRDPSSSAEVEILSNRIGRNKNLDTSNSESVSTVRPFVTTDHLELLDFSDVTLTNRQNLTSTTNELPLSSTTEPTISTFVPVIQTSANRNNLSPGVIKTPASDLISDTSITSSVEPFYESDADIMASTTTIAPTTDPEDNNELALEINGGLSSMSTVFPYLGESQEDDENAIGNQLNSLSRIESPNTTPAPELATTIFSLDAQSTGYVFRGQPVTLSTLLTPPSQKPPTTEILPPRFTTEESNEQLYGAHSQSFVTGNQNSLADGDDKGQRKGKLVEPITVSYEFINQGPTEAPRREPVNTTTTPGSPRGHYITKSIPSSLLTTTTESPITTTTESANTVTYPDTGKISPNPWSQLSYTVFLDPLTINDGLMDSKENGDSTASLPSPTTVVYEPTTEPSSDRNELRASFREDSSTVRDVDIATTTETMQRRANEMFGGLNETSVNHLMNVMKKADSNQKVRRLILLLIQTCDEDYDRTVEESRKALLDALIGMDNNEIDETKVQIINGRNGRKIDLNSVRNAVDSQQQTATTDDIPVTTYRGNQKLSVAPSIENRLANPIFIQNSPNTLTTEAISTLAPATTTTQFAATGTTQIPRMKSKPKGVSRKRPVSRDNDEYLSEETLSTFAEFGRRTTPLGSATTPTSLSPAYTTEVPDEQQTTFYPVFSRTRQRLQETTTFEPIVDTTTPPPTTTTSTTTTPKTTTPTTTTTSTTPTPTKSTTTTTTTPSTPAPTPPSRATRGPRRSSTTKVPITTTTAAAPPRGRIGKSVESFLGDASAPGPHSDDRALDLLKSLYSLAAKWGRR